MGFFAAHVKAQGVPQTVEITKVDVQKVAAGYRASKVIGSSVLNDANERIGRMAPCRRVSQGGRQSCPFFQSTASWACAPTWSSSVATISSLPPTTRLCCRAVQRTGLRCCRRSNAPKSDCQRGRRLLAMKPSWQVGDRVRRFSKSRPIGD